MCHRTVREKDKPAPAIPSEAGTRKIARVQGGFPGDGESVRCHSDGRLTARFRTFPRVHRSADGMALLRLTDYLELVGSAPQARRSAVVARPDPLVRHLIAEANRVAQRLKTDPNESYAIKRGYFQFGHNLLVDGNDRQLVRIDLRRRLHSYLALAAKLHERCVNSTR
jgi:hypothetical protein